MRRRHLEAEGGPAFEEKYGKLEIKNETPSATSTYPDALLLLTSLAARVTSWVGYFLRQRSN